METTTQEHAGAKMCRAGSKTERPCWREATEADLGETEPTLCHEHMQLRRRVEDLDGLLGALEATQSFLKSETVEGDPHGVLREFALLWCEEVTEKAAEASHKARVAEYLAVRGRHDKGPQSGVMREYEAHLVVRSDAKTEALVALVDGGAYGDGAPGDDRGPQRCFEAGKRGVREVPPGARATPLTE